MITYCKNFILEGGGCKNLNFKYIFKLEKNNDYNYLETIFKNLRGMSASWEVPRTQLCNIQEYLRLQYFRFEMTPLKCNC